MIVLNVIMLVILCNLKFIGYTHLYQLESYDLHHFLKRFFNRLSFIDMLCFVLCLSLLIVHIVFCFETIQFIIICNLLLIIIIKSTIFLIKKARIKITLKYTKRVIRLLILYNTICLLTLSMLYLTKTYIFEIVYLVDFFIFVMSTLLALPIEKLVYEKYIMKAKKRLRKFDNLKIIAITGSFGKTSVKNILTELLSQKYNVCSTPASYNTPMGICKCILNNLKPYHNILVLEFGAKKVGEIKYLCDKFCPEYGIITSVGAQHIDTFKSIENILKTKMELFEYIDDKQNVFLNYSNMYIKEYLSKAKSFKNCNLVFDNNCIVDSDVDDKKCSVFKFSNVKANINGTSFDFGCPDNLGVVTKNYTTSLIGVHNVTNIALAIAVGKKFGLTDSQISCGLSNLKPIEHRLELKRMGDYIIIDNAYNSNPISFKCAIDTLCLFQSYRKIVITPGVVDQGLNSYKVNYDLGKYMSTRVEFVYVVNKTNRDALISGLLSGGFTQTSIVVCDRFSDVEFTDFVKGDVVLIENDLPDNYD